MVYPGGNWHRLLKNRFTNGWTMSTISTANMTIKPTKELGTKGLAGLTVSGGNYRGGGVGGITASLDYKSLESDDLSMGAAAMTTTINVVLTEAGDED